MRPPGRSPLRVETLEQRDTPALITLQAFDNLRSPRLMPGWSQAATHGEEFYAVTRTQGLSGRSALGVYGTPDASSFAWVTGEAPRDVVVSAAVRADTPSPVVVYARGRGLKTDAPSYVGVAVAKGGAVELREVTNGSVRVLQSVTPAEPLDKSWLRVSVTMRGTAVELMATRADDGRTLTANGTWQAAKTVTANGTVAIADGVSGIGRLAGPTGMAFVDDFVTETVPPTVPPPPVVVPPVVPPTVPPPPVVVPPVVPPVTPPTVPPPAPSNGLPRHYDHIRIASLAYSATPVGAFETTLLRDSVDLVVSNPKFLDTFAAAGPETPQLVYSNVSNLYGDLLTDWLGYADRTGADREAAFYHVAEATAWQGDSPSSQPVTWFWQVIRFPAVGNGVDLTSAARGRGTATVTFGGAGEQLTLAFPDRFREVNVDLNTMASGSWSGAWEYVAAVDPVSGCPAVWKPLSLLADGTNNLRADGQIVFDPPADWVSSATTVGGTKLFTVRLRSTAGTAAEAPVAKSILGRDFVAANGGVKGTIPAFDTVADVNHDDYLSDAEYANRRSGFDARFESESRLFYPYYGQMRFVTNPTSPSVHAWAAEFHQDILAQYPVAGGIFLDNSNGKPPLDGAKTVEPSKDHPANSAKLVAAVTDAVAPKLTMVNSAGARAEANPVAAAADIAFEEFLLRPTTATWSQVLDAKDIVDMRLKAGAKVVVLDSHAGSTALTDDRTEIGTLAYYYLLADPDRTMLMFYGGHQPSAAWDQKWTPAVNVDVGRPTGAMTVFASGADPTNAALEYRVFARQYEDALVLYKPVSYKLGKGTGNTADATVTTHALGGSYRAVKADGTLGDVVTTITLRNGEGAVLVKA